MGNVYTVDSEQNLILYSTGNYICLRTAIGENLTRPIILRSDYASDLSDIVYNGTIYYAYQNTNKDIVIRSIMERDDLYKISSLNTPDCFSPQIAAIQKSLILFYFVKNPIDNSYCLKSLFPFEPEKKLLLPETLFSSEAPHSVSGEAVFDALPTLRILSVGATLFAHLSCHTEGLLISVDKSLQCSKLVPEYDFPAEELAQYKEESQKAKDALVQYEEESQKNRNALSLAQKELDKNKALLSQMQTQISHLQAELSHRDRLIESIRSQYEELMDTAKKYREEAIKWHNKFYGK